MWFFILLAILCIAGLIWTSGPKWNIRDKQRADIEEEIQRNNTNFPNNL